MFFLKSVITNLTMKTNKQKYYISRVFIFVFVAFMMNYLVWIFIVSSVSLSLCFYVSPLYLSTTPKPNLTLNIPAC
jgi:hypothetical protein